MKLTELQIEDETSLKLMQPVSLAMREALLHLDTHQFGENRQRNKTKSDKLAQKNNPDNKLSVKSGGVKKKKNYAGEKKLKKGGVVSSENNLKKKKIKET